VVRPMTPRTPHVPAGTLEARAAAQAITDWYFGPNALDGTGAGLAAMEALRAALGAAPVAPDPAVSRVASMTGTHECWDGDNFIERHPELLDREDVLAALGAAPVAPSRTRNDCNGLGSLMGGPATCGVAGYHAPHDYPTPANGYQGETTWPNQPDTDQPESAPVEDR
jgi:hypothetical protein